MTIRYLVSVLQLCLSILLLSLAAFSVSSSSTPPEIHTLSAQTPDSHSYQPVGPTTDSQDTDSDRDLLIGPLRITR